MPKSTAPFKAPEGKKWCVRHNNGSGSFLPVSAFPNERYSYCLDCKREYQREWDRTKRKRPVKPIEPSAKLSKDSRRILITLPNDEKGRLITRNMFERYPEYEADL